MKTLLACLLVLGALLAGSASGVGANNGFRPAGIVPHSGGKPAMRAASTVNTAGTFTCGSITCSEYATGVNGYLQDVAADSGGANNVYSATTQYFDGTGNIAYSETFGGTYVDTHAYPTSGCPTPAAGTCLTEAQLVTEIGKDLATNGWTAKGTNLFFILLPANVDTCGDSNPLHGCASNAFCAYHDSSGSLLFAVQPFAAFWGCDGSRAGEGFPNGAEIDESVNTISHEQNEAITDPNQANNAWYVGNFDENGDLCAWSFGTPLGTTLSGQPYNQVINGNDYSLQLEYSNAANSNSGGCVSHLGGPATGISNGGTGPLTYHGGPVMRTNTVYTIYWFPTPVQTPAISVAPIVSGTATVGRLLSTTTGTWTNSPTGYVYRWQRCDNAGSNCVGIANATSNHYTLVAADAGHEIRSQVKASNSGGPATAGYAPSAPTAVVVGKPTVITKPVLSGTTTVGMQLSVSTGSWTYSPTSYAYHWLRCSATGGSCVAISATTSTYTLKSADLGHTLKAKVTATNIAGSTSVTTARSAVVTT